MTELHRNRWRRNRADISLLVSAVLLCLAACGPAPNESPVPAKPNILLVVVDTLRADHLSLYGYGRKTSPRLDRLAADSLVFEKAFTVMSHTLPAHISLLTGIHPASHQVLSNGWVYEGKYPLLAERLGEAGYATAGFVSGFPLRRQSGIARGFETYVDTSDAAGEVQEKVDGEVATENALEWLDARPDRPFFLFLHYFDTHNEYTSPPDGPTFEPDAALRAYMDDIGVTGLKVSDVSAIALHLDGRRLNFVNLLNTYDNQIRRVDGLIADLLAGLDRAGVTDDTLVVITSDHGEGLGQHGYFSHGARLYEEQIRIPLIVKPSRSMRLEPARTESAVSILDVAPTILEAAGVPYEGLHGASLQSTLQASPDRDARWLLVQRRHFPQVMRDNRGSDFAPRFPLDVVRGDASLKYFREGDGSEELYDLQADPRETRNLAEARPEDVERLRTLMSDLRERRSADSDPVVPEVDEETRKKLESLGYIQ